jgi:hypothetical protein
MANTSVNFIFNENHKERFLMNLESLLLQCQKCFHRQSSGCGKIGLGVVLRVWT